LSYSYWDELACRFPCRTPIPAKAVFDALNAVHDGTETRIFIRLDAITLAFSMSAIVLLLVALACVIVLPVTLDDFPQPSFVGANIEAGAVTLSSAAGTALMTRGGPLTRRGKTLLPFWDGR
jgi:membrane protein